ncbi:MAG: ComEC/Rec2 family competence protein [Candidatus Bathyarchaeota archaeon]|nr:ComEC/Rec2 family competence protein [Candidatus Bathyarchaeum tardum]
MNNTKTVLIVILVFALFSYNIPLTYPEAETNVTVHFIDVGQGDSIFIDTHEKDVLIDAGSKSATQTVLNYLANLNITHIHLVLATHAHEDHIGGLVGVLNSNITIDTVLYNNQTYTSATYTNFVSAAQPHNLTVAQRGQIYILTQTTNLTVLNPVQPLEFSHQNDNSIVTKLQTGNISFLFTGDAETPAENSMLISSVSSLQCDVLKIGHHGSKTATSQTLLDITNPKYAIISAGLNNKYGHPHNETLQTLETKNVTTYCTINSGSIVIQTTGNDITFLDNPTPIIIPEIPQTLVLLVLAVTLTAAVFCKQKRTKTNNKL